ncbi:MAG: hypothetical protein ACI3Y0_12540 [Prevotella sp.]
MTEVLDFGVRQSAADEVQPDAMSGYLKSVHHEYGLKVDKESKYTCFT